MIISDDIKEKYSLTDEAITDITTLHEETLNKILPEKELAYDTKYKEQYSSLANENGEKLATSIADSVANEFGLDKREKGEKLKDYYVRIENSYKERLKSASGDKEGFVSLEKSKHDEWAKKLAKYDDLEKKANEYETLKEKNERLAKENAFTNVKPTFSKDANQFEVDKRWEIFENEVSDKYDIKKVDGVYKAVNKENEFDVVDLQKLVDGNESLKSITSVRKQGGIGTSPDMIKADGIPFEIPKGAHMTVVYAKIEEHLKSKGLQPHQDKYSVEFEKLREKVKQAIKA